MSSYTYTGTLTDVGLGVLAPHRPRLAVRPMVEAFGPDGLVSKVPVEVAINPATGAFSMQLIPSSELTPTAGGSPGVDYVLEVGRFEESLDGFVFSGSDAWQFTAAAGGGNIGEMNGASLLAVWLGPPWPREPLPKGIYIDQSPPNDWGIVT